jgi:hypothetical protein
MSVAAKALIEGHSTGYTIAEAVTVGDAFRSRHVAFKIVSQAYSFLGYDEAKVPFAFREEVTIEPSADAATLISIRAFLRDTLLAEIFAAAPGL